MHKLTYDKDDNINKEERKKKEIKNSLVSKET